MSVDKGLVLCGKEGFYQYTVAFLLMFIGITTNICYAGLFLMETAPLVEIFTPISPFTSSSSEQQSKVEYQHQIVSINYDICNDGNYTIMSDISKHTWVYDYGIYCDKFKVSLIGFFYCVGCILGSLSLQLYSGKKGPKDSIVINCIIFIGFSLILIMFKSIYVLYLCICGFGFCSISTLLLKVAFLSEITSHNIRPFLNNFILSSSNITLVTLFFVFENNIHWETIYMFNTLLLACLTATFYLFTVESPNFLFNKEDKFQFIIAILSINESNKKQENGGNSNKECVKQYLSEFQIPNLFEKVAQNLSGYSYLMQHNDINMSNSKISCSTLDEEDITVVNSFDKKTVESDSESEISNSSKQLSTSSLPEIRIEPKDMMYLKYNFIISFGLFNFLTFVFNLSMKEYSYYFHNKVYVSAALSMFSSLPLSYLMNKLGRKGTKIIIMTIFMVIIYLKALDVFEFSFLILLFLSNKLLVHLISMVHHTHLNETFCNKTRITVASWAYILGKLLSMLAPFILEYLQKEVEHIILVISAFCMVLILKQNETNKSSKETN